MTLLSWIKSFFGPLHVADHATLGKAVAVSRFPSGSFYWEVSDEFQFRGFSILLVFEAGETGPTNAQAKMWDHIKGHFEQLLESSRECVRPVWAKTNADLELVDFKPVVVDLLNDEQSSQDWELRLHHEATGRGYVVQFKGDMPITVEAD